ncbi:olfactory receptor 51A4-like [Alligator mississippiensis]|uniref:Olfactory receptor 51A4-like n=1 Tax=Alligator mississippiensis TaxID=8496 RepID=A0A151M1D8_ALLMI|nr:olfactory receptor 51A4-like [Alligator mississippiensis]
MYLFLLMLAVSDLGLSTALLPTMLSLFLFGHQEVSAGACFSQLFFIHTFSIMESSVLLAMAFDRFVAICKPLRYPSILTRTRVVQIGFAIAVRSIVLHLPLPFLLQGQRYCQPNVLSHSYCLHPDVMKLACTNGRYSSYGLFVVFSTMGMDPVFIVFSYAWILKSVLSIVSVEGRIKALNTCASHISVVVIFYTPMLVLSLINRLGLHVTPFIHILLSFLHFLVPPVLNPLLYCVKMKEPVEKAGVPQQPDERKPREWGSPTDDRFQYCKANVLSHSYCLHQEVMKMACSDIRVNSIYGLFVIVSTVGMDSLLILLSYVMILRAVLSIASQEERLKALNTCVSHICAVLLFYTPMIGLSIVHRFGKDLSPVVQILMGYVYLLVPPLMNPIVYSVKTKQIRAQMVKTFFK